LRVPAVTGTPKFAADVDAGPLQETMRLPPAVAVEPKSERPNDLAV